MVKRGGVAPPLEQLGGLIKVIPQWRQVQLRACKHDGDLSRLARGMGAAHPEAAPGDVVGLVTGTTVWLR